MSNSNWKVTAIMAGPIAGDVPYLCAVLEWQMALVQGKAFSVRRDQPAPPLGAVDIPVSRASIGGMGFIPRSSAPIYMAHSDVNEHFHKRLGTEHSELLAVESQRKIAAGAGYFKGYRMPLRVRNVERVVWFVGDARRQGLRRALRQVKFIGKKRSYGYGAVAEWVVEPADADYSWFAKTDRGTVLMRTLPWCDELPADLIGYRRDFVGVVPPLWHPDRFVEAVVPC